MVTFMTKHPANEAIQQEACLAINNLCINNGEFNIPCFFGCKKRMMAVKRILDHINTQITKTERAVEVLILKLSKRPNSVRAPYCALTCDNLPLILLHIHQPYLLIKY